MTPKYPQQTIQDLLARVDLVDLLEPHVKLKKQGANYSGLCPFHQEKTPSFSVNPQKQFFHCFGCGAHGDAIDFVGRIQNLGFLEAVEWLAGRYGITLVGQSSEEDHAAPLYQILAAVAEYYQVQYAANPVAQAYLQSRGLQEKTIREFQIGFAPPQWDSVLKRFGGTPEKEALLLAAGLIVRKDNGQCYDRFRDRIMFPIFDGRRRIIGFGGRVLDKSLPKYLNSPQTQLFYKSKALYGAIHALGRHTKPTEIIVVEGYLDVLSVYQNGLPAVVATLGTAMTAEHLGLLFRWTDAVWLCFDGDSAGQQAAWRALVQALPILTDGNVLRFVLLPAGMDPDSLIQTQGVDAFKRYCSEALPFDQFFFNHLLQDNPIDTMDGKARFSHVCKNWIAQMKPGVLQTLMFQKLQQLIYTPKQSAAIRKKPKGPVLKPSSVAQKLIDILNRYPIFSHAVTEDWSILLERSEQDCQTLCQLMSQLQAMSIPAVKNTDAMSEWVSLCSEEALLKEFHALLGTLVNQSKQQVTKHLISEAKKRTLTEAEKEQLNFCLKSKAGLVKKASTE